MSATMWRVSDVRFAVRQLRSAPGFALAVLATLALPVGANTALFSLVNAVILRPLPVVEPDRLIVLQARDERGDANRPIYYSTFTALASLPVFESLSLYSGGGLFQLEVRGTRVEHGIEASTPGLFESLGLAPHAGRFFTDEDAPGDGPAAAVVVISHDLWRRAFGADAKAIGETMLISGTPATVIGVTPPEFKGFYIDGGLGFSVPLSFLNRDLGTDPKRPVRGLNAIGRLAAGVSLDQARAAVDTVWPTLRVASAPAALSRTERLDIATQWITVDTLATGFSALRRQYRDPLLIVFGGSAALLLLGCVNLSGLLLARTVGRRHELAMHMALGASWARMARQLLVEHLLLCCPGALCGLLIAWWFTVLAGHVLWPGTQPLALRLTPDVRVFAFASLLAVAATLLVTILPAWTVARTQSIADFQGSRSVARGSHVWIRSLLATQVALSLVLLVAAGLLGTSLVKLRTMPTGVQHDGLRWSRLFAVPNGYRNQHDASYYPELVRQLSAVPGVDAVALAQHFPTYFAYEGLLGIEQVAPHGRADASEVGALMERITPRFFETVGIPMARGRDFSWSDDKDRPAVAIVNESLRRLLFPSVDPIGQRIRIGADPSRAAVEVIAVVDDAVIGGFKRPNVPVVFRPRMQDVSSPRAPVMLFRTADEVVAADARMAAVIADLGHEYPRRFYSLDEQIDIALLRERLLAGLSSFFAALAVLLAAVGLYSAFALVVARRTRELGVRMALGASRSSVARMVIRESAAIAILGITLGVPAALLTGGLMSSWVFGVQPHDAATLVAASLFLMAIGVLASLRPALWAASIDPATTLRAE